MRNKIMVIVILSMFMLIILSGTCFAASIKFIIAAGYTPQQPFSRSMEWVKRTIERRTNGEIDVEYYPGGQLGYGKELMDSVISGDIDYTMLGPREAGRYVTEIGIFNAPYIFRDFEHAYKVMEGSIGKKMEEKLLDKIGIRTVGVYEYGSRYLTTANKIVKSPKDLHGVKIRVMDEPVSIAVMQAMGAVPVPISFGELYLALKQGIVEGQENPIANIIAQSFDEVQKYLILTGHVHNMGSGYMNEAKFQSLSPRNQEILISTLMEGVAICNFLQAEDEKEGFKIWKEAGNEIIEVDVDLFKKPVAESIFYDLKKDEWKDLYEEIQAVE